MNTESRGPNNDTSIGACDDTARAASYDEWMDLMQPLRHKMAGTWMQLLPFSRDACASPASWATRPRLSYNAEPRWVQTGSRRSLYHLRQWLHVCDQAGAACDVGAVSTADHLEGRMADFWTTRSGRWRLRLREENEGELHERLFRVIRNEIEDGRLPAGAIMPVAERVADELRIEVDHVEKTFQRLLVEGLIEQRDDQRLRVADVDGDAQVGVETQVLFEQNLIEAARHATELGLSTVDATGVFKARIREIREAHDQAAVDDDDNEI